MHRAEYEQFAAERRPAYQPCRNACQMHSFDAINLAFECSLGKTLKQLAFEWQPRVTNGVACAPCRIRAIRSSHRRVLAVDTEPAYQSRRNACQMHIFDAITLSFEYILGKVLKQLAFKWQLPVANGVACASGQGLTTQLGKTLVKIDRVLPGWITLSMTCAFFF